MVFWGLQAWFWRQKMNDTLPSGLTFHPVPEDWNCGRNVSDEHLLTVGVRGFRKWRSSWGRRSTSSDQRETHRRNHSRGGTKYLQVKTRIALLYIIGSPVEKKCPCRILFLVFSAIYFLRNSGTLAELEVARSDPEMTGELLLCDSILADNDNGKKCFLYISPPTCYHVEKFPKGAYVAHTFFIRSFRSTFK